MADMKYSILLLTFFSVLLGCSPSPITSKGSTGTTRAGGPTDPSNPKPTFSGKPGDFNKTWRGNGVIENTGAKTRLDAVYTVKVTQTIDAASNLPTDMTIALTMTDKIGDVVYSALLTGFVIKARELTKTSSIYEIFETSTKNKVGEIGETAFAFYHTYPGSRLLNIDVNFPNMSVNGYKLVNKNKTLFRAQLIPVP